MFLHDPSSRNWRNRLLTVLVAASCLLGIGFTTAQADGATITRQAATTTAQSTAPVAVRTASVGNACIIPGYKTYSGTGSAKHPCNIKIVHYADVDFPSHYTRTYNAAGDSIWLEYHIGYYNDFSPRSYGFADTTYNHFFVTVDHVWGLNGRTINVGIQYLNLVVFIHYNGVNYSKQFRCGSGTAISCHDLFAYNYVGKTGHQWAFGGGDFESSTRHRTFWGGISHLSAVVQHRYVPNTGHTLGSRKTVRWRAEDSVDW